MAKLVKFLLIGFMALAVLGAVVNVLLFAAASRDAGLSLLALMGQTSALCVVICVLGSLYAILDHLERQTELLTRIASASAKSASTQKQLVKSTDSLARSTSSIDLLRFAAPATEEAPERSSERRRKARPADAKKTEEGRGGPSSGRRFKKKA